jgi:uncharacterized protein (DUF433 family)
MHHLKLPNVPGIVSTPDTCWGRTRFDGTRIPVTSIIGCMAGGDSEAKAMDSYGLTREQMRAMYELFYRLAKRLP